MARPTTKTPQQLFEEAQKKAEAAKVRLAKATAATNPQIATLNGVLDSYNKDIAAFSRKLVGRNSFANRLRSLELRKAWVEAEQREIVASDAAVRKVKDYVQHSIAGLSVRIANGETVTDADVQEVMNNLPTSNLYELTITTMEAETAWRSFTESIAASANDPAANTEGV